MTPRKRHIRQAIVEQLSVGDLEIPAEAAESWKALKSYMSGYGDAPIPTSRQIQDLYELVLGYQVFCAGAYRVAHVPVAEAENGRDPGMIDPADIPLIILP